MSNNITVIGTIATDPRLVNPSGGTPICSFRLASDERRYDREQQAWVEGNTNWFGVACFRNLAGHAHESFRKGDRVIANGKLRVRKWEKDGKRGTSVEIEAEAIGHDLRWGVTRFEKRFGATASPQDTTSSQEPAASQELSPTHEATPDAHGFTAAVHSDEHAPAFGPDGFTPLEAAA
ncbi:MAG: single-stranded DNA-binding protein [Leucobacter sp.]|nr:single-stranded DNA-binding protein [Leucobacter sp.]